MKIVLVNPPPRGALQKHWAKVPILGLACIAASLRARGHHVVLADGKLGGLSLEEIHEVVLRSAPGLIGITCMTVDFPTATAIAQRIRAAGCETPIVLGGAHVNAVGAAALHECPPADFACVGEGEHLAVELADALEGGSSLEGIRGLARREDGGVVRSTARDYPTSYDALPFPAWDLFARAEQIPVLTHRGCPFECNFCGHNSGFTPRYRSPENVVAEIAHVVERFAPRVIRFEDETFGLSMPRTRAILEGIITRRLHRRTEFSAQTRVDRLDLDFVRLLRASGFTTLELGVESGNEEILRRMGKGISLPQVERAVRLGRAAGLSIQCKFILGHPFETAAQMRDTARFIARVNPDRLSVALMTPYPGTPIFDMAMRGEGEYRMLSDNWTEFDKYASGALELEGVSLSMLKAYQVLCYLQLYVQNGRFGDLARTAYRNRGVVGEMLAGLVGSAVSGQPRSSRRPRSTSARDLPLSDVASPDATLIRLRRRDERRAPAPPPSPDGRTLRTWASPGK